MFKKMFWSKCKLREFVANRPPGKNEREYSGRRKMMLNGNMKYKMEKKQRANVRVNINEYIVQSNNYNVFWNLKCREN